MNEIFAVKQNSKEDSKILKWVSLACSKDKARSVLLGIKVNNGEIAAADGFRLHIAPTPDALKPHNDKILKPTSTLSATPKYDEFETDPGTFPDYQQIVPTDEPTFKIALNKKYLAALATMPGDEYVVLEFTKPTSPIKITSPSSEAVAVIMPMRLGCDSDWLDNWKAQQETLKKYHNKYNPD